MAAQDDVRRIALALPGTEERSDRFAFAVRNKNALKDFAWVWMERLAPKQPRVPRPDVVALRVANLEEKDIILSLDTRTFFTEPHYNGFPAILVRLPEVGMDELEDLVIRAWRCQAPRALAVQFESAARSSGGG
jgi:hypothetical protein